MLKGALLGAWVGSMSTMVVGVGLSLFGAATGAQLFAFGALWATFLGLVLFSLGIKVQSPELDPSDMPKVDLPTFK